MNQPPDTQASQTGASQTTSGRNALRARLSARITRWRQFWLGLLVLAATLWILAWLGLSTDWGSRQLWRGLTRIAPGQISGEWLGGNWRDGVRLRELRYRDDLREVRIDYLQSTWRWSLRPATWHVAQLSVGNLDLTVKPSPPEPRALPRHLHLPFSITLDDLRIDQIRLHQDSTTTLFKTLRLSAQSNGVQHRLQLRRLDTPWGSANAALRLSGDAPFALDGTAHWVGAYAQYGYQVGLTASGDLNHTRLALSAQGRGVKGEGDLIATPFAETPFERAHLNFPHLNPRAFNPDWPQADLQLQVALQPSKAAFTSTPAAPTRPKRPPAAFNGDIDLRNAQPGVFDQGLLPLISLQAALQLEGGSIRIPALTLMLPAQGQITGAAHRLSDGRLSTQLQVRNLNPQTLHRQAVPVQLSGPINLEGDALRQHFTAKLNNPTTAAQRWLLDFDATLTAKAFSLARAHIQVDQGRIDLTGSMDRDAPHAYDLKAQLHRIDPAQWLTAVGRSATKPKKFTSADFTAEVAARGTLQPNLALDVNFRVAPGSTYAQLPFTGEGRVRWQRQRLLPSRARLSIASNELNLDGAFGAPADRLRVAVNAPALERIGFGLAGRLRLDGTLRGNLHRPAINARFQASDLKLGELQLRQAQGNIALDGMPGQALDAQLAVDLSASKLHAALFNLQQLNLTLAGTYAKHRLKLQTRGQIREQAIDLELAAQGRLRDLPNMGLDWQGTLDHLVNRTTPSLTLQAPWAVHLARDHLNLGPARLMFNGTAIELQHLDYTPASLRSAGRIDALALAPWLALQQSLTGQAPSFGSDLVVAANWDFTLGQKAQGFIELKRLSGDLTFTQTTGQPTLGLQALTLRGDFTDHLLRLTGQLDSTRSGALQLNGNLGLTSAQPGALLMPLPTSTLALRLGWQIPSLRPLASLAGPGLALDGKLTAALRIEGQLAAPQLSGHIDGSALSMTLYDQGIRLQDGIMRLQLQNNVLELKQLQFRGGDGTLRAEGNLALDAHLPQARITVVADRLQLLASPAAQLRLSGQAQIANDSQGLQVDGSFKVDQALFNLPEQSAPRLDDDVIVHRPGDIRNIKPRASSVDAESAIPTQRRVNIALDLGPNFRFEGAGAALRLAGKLDLRSDLSNPPQVFGSLRVAEGEYEAFGTRLEIERGLINFQGAPDNPNLTVVAMRRTNDVSAGVRITGTLQQPRVQLVSEPNVSDEEKLSWLMFGRAGGGDSGQAQAAAQGAALGLLNKIGGQRVAQRLGLDDLSIGESEAAGTGASGAQVVNLGKALTDKLYLGYEQSLAGTSSIVKLTYELSRYWSVVLRGGGITGLDVFYSRRFDKLGQAVIRGPAAPVDDDTTVPIKKTPQQ